MGPTRYVFHKASMRPEMDSAIAVACHYSTLGWAEPSSQVVLDNYSAQVSFIDGQVLEEWDTATLERGGVDNITTAIRAACGDAVGEVRSLPAVSYICSNGPYLETKHLPIKVSTRAQDAA